MNAIFIALVAAPLLLLWALHWLGFDSFIVEVLCLFTKGITLGKWQPDPNDVDELAAISIAGSGLSLITAALGFACQG